VTAIVIAFAVFAAAAVFAWTTFSGRVQEATPSTRTSATSGSPAGVDLSLPPEGFAVPREGRQGV
jgi:hypothetical protein